ncbi:MAG TPA: BlaI/MecI/CopY family transcriptional regulator [Flavitalea sp.]|nr:BlaI/MecI/CopY family transcriptional regulator [Flavitalea sp.]
MKTLTKAEEQVMHTLWKLRQGFLKDILESFPEPKPHSNTVATLLKILVEKGFVEPEVRGRNNLYRVKITKAEYGKKTIQHLVKGYFDGSPSKVVSHFVADNKLTVEDLETLLQEIRNAKNSNP